VYLYTYTCVQKITKWLVYSAQRSFIGGISRSNLSKSLNDTSLIKNDLGTPPLSCLFLSAFAPEVSESLPVSFCTTDLKLVASVSTYWVLIMTTFTGPLLHPPVAIVEKDEFFLFFFSVRNWRNWVEWVWNKRGWIGCEANDVGVCVYEGLMFGVVYIIWVGCIWRLKKARRWNELTVGACAKWGGRWAYEKGDMVKLRNLIAKEGS